MESLVAADLVAARAEKLFFYSPYNFLRGLNEAAQQELFGTGLASRFLNEPDRHLFDVTVAGYRIQFLYTYLVWDTDFFQSPCYKLFTLLFDAATPLSALTQATQAFIDHLRQKGRFYVFMEMPAEDTLVSQALGGEGWRLVETRLTFFHDTVASFAAERYPVRLARPEEAARIGQVSRQARNVYDRFHADTWFSPAQGDDFLDRYAAAAVEGYQDAVLVPDEPGLPVDSFLAINDLREHGSHFNTGLARVVLTAVGPANRGWHLKLVSETLHRAREQGADYLLMTTQATNRAVFRTCEKVGLRLGGCTHILSFSYQD